MSKVIFISGTPCVGKTTIAEKLCDELNSCELIKINDLAISNDFILGEEPNKGYKIIDIDSVDNLLSVKIANSSSDFIVVEGHVSHLLSNPDLVVILRCTPSILKERLAMRNYSSSKISENLEAEALGVCSFEAFDIHGNKVNELDCSFLSIDEVISNIKSILFSSKTFPIGEVDFMSYFL